MIVDEPITVIWRGSSNKNYYESLGYNYTKEFDKFTISSLHLLTNSLARISAKCEQCGCIKKIRRRSYTQTEERNGKYVCSSCLRKNKFKEVHPWIDLYNEFRARGVTILHQEIDHHKQKVKFICDEHPTVVQDVILHNFWNNTGSGCKLCKAKKQADDNRVSYTTLVSEFSANNLVLLSAPEVYVDNKSKLEFMCLNHPEQIQTKSYDSFWQVKMGRTNAVCKFCQKELRSGENSHHWLGGQSDIFEHLRRTVNTWRVESAKNYNSRCVITNKKYEIVHHLYPFAKITRDAHKILDIKIKPSISEYSKEELLAIEKEVLHKHYELPLGVPLTTQVHEQFHKLYGIKNFTPENFYEFKENYHKGLIQV